MAQTLPNIPPTSEGRDDESILATISANVISIGESVTTMAMIAQSDARADSISSANVAENDLLTGVDNIGDAGNPNSEDSSSSGGGGGFFSKLLAGAGAGAGLLIGGFGALLAGGGVLLKAFNDFDGELLKVIQNLNMLIKRN